MVEVVGRDYSTLKVRYQDFSWTDLPSGLTPKPYLFHISGKDYTLLLAHVSLDYPPELNRNVRFDLDIFAKAYVENFNDWFQNAGPSSGKAFGWWGGQYVDCIQTVLFGQPCPYGASDNNSLGIPTF